MSYWQDKVVIVAGGSRGFGKILAATLVAKSARVILFARDPLRLQSATQELNEPALQSHPVTFLEVDLTDESATRTAVQNCANDFGTIDAVFNCVGKSTREALLDCLLYTSDAADE